MPNWDTRVHHKIKRGHDSTKYILILTNPMGADLHSVQGKQLLKP